MKLEHICSHRHSSLFIVSILSGNHKTNIYEHHQFSSIFIQFHQFSSVFMSFHAIFPSTLPGFGFPGGFHQGDRHLQLQRLPGAPRAGGGAEAWQADRSQSGRARRSPADGKSPDLMGKRPSFMGKHDMFMGKHQILVAHRQNLMGKRQIFLGNHQSYMDFPEFMRISHDCSPFLKHQTMVSRWFRHQKWVAAMVHLTAQVMFNLLCFNSPELQVSRPKSK